MSWVFGVVAVSLGVLFLWGLVAPRNQWWMLSSWSVTDPHSHAPGGATYGLRRMISGFGLLALSVVGIVGAAPIVASQLPQQTRELSAVEVMWGNPAPHLVARVVTGFSEPPADLVEVPVLGYQVLDDSEDVPGYLVAMKHFSLLGDETPPGYIGSAPAEGFSAIGSANLVLNVRGSVLCIPRAAVVQETETTIVVAVYYGLPDAVDPAAPALDHAVGCPANDPVTSSVLLPISLDTEVGDRVVQTLDGTEVPRVKLVG